MKQYFVLILLCVLMCCKSTNLIFMQMDDCMDNTYKRGQKVKFKKSANYKYNDLVVFKLPNIKELICRRIIGMPNDKIEIRLGTLFVNDKEFFLDTLTTRIYTVKSNTADFSKILKYNFKPYSENYGMAKVTIKEYNYIKTNKLVDSIYLLGLNDFSKDNNIKDIEGVINYNTYNFGPINIPLKNSEIKSSKFYEFFDNSIKNEDIFKIENDYFFVLGDSFSDAIDSRELGLISSKYICGLVEK